MAITYSSSALASALIADLRLMGEFKGDATKGPFTDAFLLALINSAIRKAYGIITRYDRSRQHISDTSIPTVSGTESYTLPTTIADVDVVALSKTGTATGFLLLDRIDYADRNRFWNVTTSQPESTVYALSDASLYLFPTPTFVRTLLIEGRRHPPTLGATSDAWDGLGVNGWKEFVLGDVAESCARKLEEDLRPWQALKNEGREQLRINAIRDRARPRQIVDTVEDSSRYGSSRSFWSWRI